MKLIYPGPHDAVELPTVDPPITAKQGEPVEVPDDVAKSLLAQGWTKATAKAGKDVK